MKNEKESINYFSNRQYFKEKDVLSTAKQYFLKSF